MGSECRMNKTNGSQLCSIVEKTNGSHFRCGKKFYIVSLLWRGSMYHYSSGVFKTNGRQFRCGKSCVLEWFTERTQRSGLMGMIDKFSIISITISLHERNYSKIPFVCILRLSENLIFICNILHYYFNAFTNWLMIQFFNAICS